MVKDTKNTLDTKESQNKKIREDNKKNTTKKDVSILLKNLEELKSEYHINEEKDSITLKLVMDKMQERLEYYIKIIMQIMQPEEFHSLHECTVFDDSEKNEMFGLYKSMMILHREIMKSEIKNEQEDMASTIYFAHAEMKGYKKHMVSLVSKMQTSWKKSDSKGTVRYFG